MSVKGTKLLGAAPAKSSGTPSAAQLEQINDFTLADIPAEQLYTRTFALAHNFIDRDNECFDEGLLSDFVKSLPGKGVFIKHPNSWQGDGGPAMGKWYAARLQTMAPDEARTYLKEPNLQLPPDRSAAVLLMADAYFVRTSDNESLLSKIDAGIAGDVSIGFCADHRSALTDSEGRELQALRLSGPGEAYEGSLVWLGAQPGARAVKSNKSTNIQSEDGTMEIKELQAKLDASTALVTALESQKAFCDALAGCLGNDNAALADDAVKLAALALAGKAHRDQMIDDLIVADRHKGLIGDKPEDSASAKAAYEAIALPQLVKLHELHASTAKGGGAGLTGGNPNATAIDGKSFAPAGSLLANPLKAA